MTGSIRVPLLLLILAQADDAQRIPQLIEQMKSDRIEEREDAERRLKDLGSKAVPELQKVAQGSDPEVAARARDLLRVIPILERIPASIRKALPGAADRLVRGELKTWTEVFLEAAGQVPGKVPDPPIPDADLDGLVVAALKGAQSAEYRRQVCQVAGQRRLRSAIPEAIGLLRSPSTQDRWAAREVLLGNKARETLPDLLRLLDRKEALETQKAAMELLGILRLRTALPELLKMLEDSHEQIRSQALYSIAAMNAREAVPRLIPLLGDEDVNVRVSAASALSHLQARAAIPELLKLLKDPAENVRSSVAYSLASMEATEAVPSLMEALGDPDENLRAAAVYALHLLGGKEQAPAMFKLLEDPSPYVRTRAVPAFFALNPGVATPKLIELLKDNDPSVRSCAARVLGEARIGAAVPELVKILESDDVDSRTAAAYALGTLDAKAAVPALKKALAHPHAYLQDTVAYSLGEIGATDAVADLLPLLEPRRPRVSIGAIGGLGRMRAREAVPAMEKLLANPTGHVRSSAAVWLCALGSRAGVPHILATESDLLFLNALRAPEAWAHLRDRLHQTDLLRGTRREVLEAIAREVGLKVEVGTADDGFMNDRIRVERRGFTFNLLDAVQNSMSYEYEPVLEPDRIRVLPRDEAVAFWKAWWAGEQKK